MHIVIQGAGRGLGLAFAHHALRAGATKLYLTARNPQACEGFRQLKPSEHVQWFNVDFLNSDQIATFLETRLASEARRLTRLTILTLLTRLTFLTPPTFLTRLTRRKGGIPF